jgi:hypothetical protein
MNMNIEYIDGVLMILCYTCNLDLIMGECLDLVKKIHIKITLN